MYLKSIEMHGFKSFAGKIVLEFHNGITGIVGPNGSGKSNVGDAVRWVLGEQSAKQLRGASMQDVIFAGTENRKPMSFAYVAITMDNSDHVLPTDFDEVTVARRVYRSGESEYLLNGTTCRLRDVQELFYDTGIGKEGYSIIGQGQIERIIAGKPEERRELFDEAVGIVKYKKRKASAVKKLEEEQDNLVRINDILSELEERVGPLEAQAADARKYLSLRERQKTLDVNLFLIDSEELGIEKKKIADNIELAEAQLGDANKDKERIQREYSALEESRSELDKEIDRLREEEKNTTIMKGKLENEIALLEEQIRSDESTLSNFNERSTEINLEIEEREKEFSKYENEKEKLQKLLEDAEVSLKTANDYYRGIQDEINRCNTSIEANNKEIMELMEERSGVSSEQERLKTLQEQLSIRRAGLNQRLLARKTEENTLSAKVEQSEAEVEKAKEVLVKLRQKASKFDSKEKELRSKLSDYRTKSDENHRQLTKLESRLESLRNIAERYEGYGNAIRRVMEKKSEYPNIVGVVADLIHVEKKYETAIETALGGNIQNIVTEDEQTAKKMIDHLKKNRYGRATFLPITSVNGNRNFNNDDVLSEKGVLGRASELLDYDKKFKGVMEYLIGRVIICDTIDNALALARKKHHSLNIVTLEGEYLRPGGSLSGGAYKNSSNLLARNRQMEELETNISTLSSKAEKYSDRINNIRQELGDLSIKKQENSDEIQKAVIDENTLKISLANAMEDLEKSRMLDESLSEEGRTIETDLAGISESKGQYDKRLDEITAREKLLHQQNDELTKTLDEQEYLEQTATRNVSEIEMDESSARAKVTFVEENLNRVKADLSRLKETKNELISKVENSREDAKRKAKNIEEIKTTIGSADSNFLQLEEKLSKAISDKEEMDARYKGFFDKKDEINNLIGNLEKECLRLEAMREKNEETYNRRNNYMWEEYELTLHAAMELKDESLSDGPAMKQELSVIRDDIRSMGNVNVGAIEEYAETKERYDFLKGQHDDIIDAQERLTEIIDELDEGMRRQFTEGFASIQKEFDSTFKQLFGGGKGTLELVEDEDILETGIRIIAQPPGKKLQNMMQLSGGEKSLTAIALLFAIQNLKPSPFALLDEIEAALDDSNVDRFAKYLHKLTKNTQFIVITHRRGTMNSADRLYGITMQEKGISALVSVNLIENDLSD